MTFLSLLPACIKLTVQPSLRGFKFALVSVCFPCSLFCILHKHWRVTSSANSWCRTQRVGASNAEGIGLKVFYFLKSRALTCPLNPDLFLKLSFLYLTLYFYYLPLKSLWKIPHTFKSHIELGFLLFLFGFQSASFSSFTGWKIPLKIPRMDIGSSWVVWK